MFFLLDDLPQLWSVVICMSKSSPSTIILFHLSDYNRLSFLNVSRGTHRGPTAYHHYIIIILKMAVSYVVIA